MSPNAAATATFTTNVYIVVGSNTWTSPSTTVDDSVTHFTVSGSQITLDTATNNIIARGVQTPPYCTLTIYFDGVPQVPTYDCGPGFRVYFLAQASTYTATVLNRQAIAGYAEALLPTPNDHSDPTHQVRGGGQSFPSANGAGSAIPTVWPDVAASTISCPGGTQLREWTNITLPDGFFRSLGPRDIATC
jgi:hypothetical protein